MTYKFSERGVLLERNNKKNIDELPINGLPNKTAYNSGDGELRKIIQKDYLIAQKLYMEVRLGNSRN